MADDIKYWIALHRVPGFGRVRFGLLQRHFGQMERAWRASPAELRAAGLDPKPLNALVAARPAISPDEEMERLERARVLALTVDDPAYPARLKETYDPPPVLYVRGALLPDDEWSVTVVGTRGITAYGREVTTRLVSGLSANRVTVVSGLARGVDAGAHEAALAAGGRTIAVQACGLDLVYPAAHAGLARRIAEHGALLSDYPLGTRPRAEYFPRRNRILAGFSLGTLVVEAPFDSGALITARYALEEGREVFAVPGSILSPASRGTNLLIQEGAKAVLDVRDILEELNLQTAARQLPMPGILPENETEAALLRCISSEPSHIDEIRRASGLPMAAVSGALSLMELKGLVRQVAAMSYVKDSAVDYRPAVP